jgi:hypothetical protein
MSRHTRFAAAMASYGVLVLLATFTLDGKLRAFLYILFAALAFRTWIAFNTERGE